MRRFSSVIALDCDYKLVPGGCQFDVLGGQFETDAIKPRLLRYSLRSFEVSQNKEFNDGRLDASHPVFTVQNGSGGRRQRLGGRSKTWRFS